MPRPRKVDRPIGIEVYVPASLYQKLRDRLYSEVEGRIPHGALTGYVVELLRKDLIKETPDG